MNYRDYLEIKKFCGCKIKMQDFYPYDSFLLGMNDIYMSNDNIYYINNPHIITRGRILTRESKYLLWKKIENDLSNVEFLEAYVWNNEIHLLLKDVVLKSVGEVECPIKVPIGTQVKWRIIDLGYLISKYTKLQRSNNHETELLEFEF